MISFEPTEDQSMMRDTVAQFARASLLGRTREFEAARAVPDDVRQAAFELGLGGVALPEACGGQQLGMVTAVLLEEELGKADAGAAFGLPGPHGFGLAAVELCPERAAELVAPLLSGPDKYGAVAWSEAVNRDRAGFATVARHTEGGFTLDGKKLYVANAAAADRFLVFAQLDESAGWSGIGAFVVEADRPGVAVGRRHDTLGLGAAWFGEVAFDGVALDAGARLGADVDFTRATLRFFAKQGLLVAARAVGLSQVAFDVAREHCDTRQAFGKPIGHFQAVAFNLADRLMDVESSRWLLWQAAWSWDGGADERAALLASAQAVSQCLETAMRAADDCASLHGGMGFVRDVIAEKLMRDAKQLCLCCPTAGQFDQLAAAVEVGAELDPALLLPTPETQAIFT